MSDLEPGVQLTPDTIAAMERLRTPSPPRNTMSEIEELRTRVEALEADQLEQAESNRFCIDAIVRRVEALEATQHAHVDTSSLWQPARWITPLNGDPSKRLPDPQPGKQPRVFAAEEVAPRSVPTVKDSLTVPAGSLVERVWDALWKGMATSDDEGARAAILEVAAWIRSELNGRNVADRLEQEANR